MLIYMSLFQVTQSNVDLPEVSLYSKSVNANVVSVCDLSNNIQFSLPSVAPEVDSLLRFTAGSVVFSPVSNFELIDSGNIFPAPAVNGQMFFFTAESKPIWYSSSDGFWVYADGVEVVL